MGRTKGSKDVNQRKRPPMTESAKLARKKVATTRKQDATKASINLGVFDQFYVKKSANPSGNPDARSAASEVDEVVDEPTIPTIDDDIEADSNSDMSVCHDFGNVEAVFDDNWIEHSHGNDSSAVGKSVMFQYMQALMIQYRTEETKDFAISGKERWLHVYLRNHSNWIRMDAAHFVLMRLGLCKHPIQYYRDVFVWFPDALGGSVSCMPACVSCKSNSNVRVHSYPLNHPGRRVASFHTHYFIITREYLCRTCRIANDEAKQRDHARIQYTFMGTNESVLQSLPDDIKYQFPAILSAGAGLDKQLAHSLRPLIDKGMRPEGVSDWLRELHTLQHTMDYVCYETDLQRRKRFDPNLKPPMFSKFDDKKEYSGAVPSGYYLRSMLKKDYAAIRPALDREVKKVHINDQCSIDASYKAAKKIAQVDGNRIYNALQTMTNGIGQIRTQLLVGSDSHEQLEASLDAMSNTLAEFGKSGPNILFTDNPSRDRSFYMERFKSLRQTQAHLDKVAAEMNRHRFEKAKQPSSTPGISPSKGKTTSPIQNPYAPQTRKPIVNPYALKSNFVTVSADQYQLVASKNTATAIEALSDQMQRQHGASTQIAFSLDCEWDTVANVTKGRKKVGKVALMQIGYFSNAKYRALILRQPNEGSLPCQLQDFLQQRNHLFVGVNVKNDVRLVGHDFGIPGLEAIVNTREISMIARQRDIVQRGNHGLEELVKTVLGQNMNKGMQCSRWSSRQLSSQQMQYAALDAIKSLETYDALLKMPDLSLRIKKCMIREGLDVEIVPPHAKNNNLKPAKGYRVGDLATRAARGKLLSLQQMENPPSIRPSTVKKGDDSVFVQVTEILAPSLLIPRHTVISGASKTSAALGDFESAAKEGPLILLLPLTMLRQQQVMPDGVTVRTYGSVADEAKAALVGPARRITPPSPPLQDEAIDVVLNEICNEDKDGNNDDDDEVCQSSSQESGHSVNDSMMNARLIHNNFEYIEAAEIGAERATQLVENGGTVPQCLLLDGLLDSPPTFIEDVFSCVLGDIWHGMDRCKVSINHEYKKAYFVALVNAFLAYNPDRMDEVQSRLKDESWSDEHIKATLYFRPDFFRERVERVALAPHKLYWRVRAVYAIFGPRRDSRTNAPLFNEVAWQKANNLLQEILCGYYSDPPGFNFYKQRLNAEGNCLTDKYGNAILHCSRGTNDVENIHKSYNTAFRYGCGVELGDGILAERRHRHNINVAIDRIPGYPKIGHYNTWLIDKLQIMVERNHKILLFPDWINASDYKDTDESFLVTAIHSEQLHFALKDRCASISNEVMASYTGDLRFLCNSIGVDIPFLPVMGEKEYRLFTQMLINGSGTFNAVKMAQSWMNHVDGEFIYPKYPHQLRFYYKKWERNRRVQKAVKAVQSSQVVLDEMNRVQGLVSINNNGDPHTGTLKLVETVDVADCTEANVVETVDVAVRTEANEVNDDTDQIPTQTDFGEDVTHQMISGQQQENNQETTGPSHQQYVVNRASLPTIPEHPSLTAMISQQQLEALFVGMHRIGFADVNTGICRQADRSRGQRGKDAKPRKGRVCSLCKRFAPNNTESASTCPGRGGKQRCENYHVDGSPKLS